MKKYSLYLLAALGFFMASCDETDIPVSKPQENAPEDVLAPGDIVVDDAGPLASSAVFNLNDYANDPDAHVPVLTLTSAMNVPEGADISFQMIMASSDAFDHTYNLYPQYGDTEETSKTLYVTAGDWNNAHLYLVGRNPETKTLYYRIPVFVNVDGTSYSYVSADYYIAQGAIEEKCIDQGLVIEDNYYFLSNATTWDLNENALNFAMYHNPDASVYDDPVFTYVFTQSGDNWWKIAPASAVASEDWGAVLGTTEDGDTSTSGILTDSDAQAGKIEGQGKFEIKINIEDMTYDIYDLSKGVYLVGAPQGWSVESDAILLPETEPGSNIYTGEVYVGADEFIFRFYHVLGSWDMGSIGSNNTGANEDISLADGSYSGPVYQEGVNASSAQGNWQIPGWEGGEIEITINLNDFTIEMSVVEETVEHVDMYLRGGMNDWADSSSYQFTTTDEENVWLLKSVTIPAGTEFKFADKDWGTINYGCGEDANVAPGKEYVMTYNGGNMVMSEDFTGSATVTLTAAGDYVLLLTPSN